ncbi:0dd64c92-3f07-4aa0-99ac-b24fad65a22e [Thermothielavioides terrestris]|uniref:0dd64c92-3f07-4aa0-99ac-b24fad65a22e n=1 Tax=Thermothielavioides terrestris TaxID=2587410 RepID=A0A3S4EYN9_9PEZI|nr:0dd64c92-3f07-4aa0-99ac-b24fad65a22e [Thermothielavioides terrestris]
MAESDPWVDPTPDPEPEEAPSPDAASSDDAEEPLASSASSSGAGVASGVASPRFPSPSLEARDIYSANPEFPAWDDSENGLRYEPWPPGLDSRIAVILTDVSEPPRNGLFERIDHRGVLQKHMEQSPEGIQKLWEKLLGAYDIAMIGKCAALHALAGAHKRIREDDNRVREVDESYYRLVEQNADLTATIDRLEELIMKQQRQLDDLKQDNRVLARDKAVFEGMYTKIATVQETELGFLEEVVAGWGTFDEARAIHSTSAGRDDLAARFQYVRETLEEAREEAQMAKRRCKQLEDKCKALEKEVEEAAMGRTSQGEPSPGAQSAWQFRAEQLELENQALESELEAERAHAAEMAKEHAQLLAELHSDGILQAQDYLAAMERLKKELVLYKDKCASLQRTVDELKKRLASQVVEATREKKEYESNMDDLEAQIQDTTARLSDVISALEGDTGAASRGSDSPHSSQAGEAVREREATPRFNMQSSRAAVDEIAATIDAVVKQISQDIAENKAIQAEEAWRISEELKKLAASADTLVEGHELMEEAQEVIDAQLDRLREQIRSHKRAFQDVRQQVCQQRAQVQATRASFHQGVPGAFGAAPFGAGDSEMQCLRRTRELIAQLKQNSGQVGTENAALQCLEQLTPLLGTLRLMDPDPSEEDAIVALVKFLEESAVQGVGHDTASFYATLDEHDDRLKSLLDPGNLALHESSEAERELLRGIQQKLEAAEALQKVQEEQMREYEAYRAQHAADGLTAPQSEELLRLAGSAVDTAGGKWTWPTPMSQKGAAGVDDLVAQVQKLTADAYLSDRRSELEDGNALQKAQLAELEEEIARALKLADNAQKQLEALARVQAKGKAPATAEEGESLQAFQDALQKREGRLRREQHLNLAQLERLQARRARAAAFLENEAASDRRRAETLLTEALLKLQAAGSPSHHGEAACFCTLLRFLFPHIYYSAVSGGCCAGGKLVASAAATSPGSAAQSGPAAAAAPACQGHHGHGLLRASGRLSTAVCRFCTALAWIVLLILIQPYNLYAAAAFLLSLLLHLPRHLYRLLASAASYAYARLRHRRQDDDRGSAAPAESSTSTSPSTPLSKSESFKLNLKPLLDANAWQTSLPLSLTQHLPQPPPPSVLVGAGLTLFLAYAWLTYVALLVERRVWAGANDWRWAYALDLAAAGQPLPYPGWAPLRVDYRLVGDGAWVWFAGWVHSLFYGR